MNYPKCGSYYVVRNGLSLSNLGCCSTPNKDINAEKHIRQEKKDISDNL